MQSFSKAPFQLNEYQLEAARAVSDRASEVLERYDLEVEELLLACLAAGVPMSKILIKKPALVYDEETLGYYIRGGLSFKEDYRCVRNEDIYQ